ncbi:MAG: hypothetical protein N3E52_07090 [Candidatus Bathyarchaeota archaeon]|nr:hypothetical protein [Candidatus Bathyarchaeota archaeon]
MIENNDNSTMTEASVVAKVAELMETLDKIKKYGVLARQLKMFTLIVVGSIVICILVNNVIFYLNLLSAFNEFQRFFMTFPLVLIPATGVAVGILFVRRKINAVKTGEWKDELSHGFPSALKILSEIDWDEAFDVVSSGRLGYVMYGLVKGAAYGFISFFILGFVFNLITYIVLHRIGALGYASFHCSLLIIFLYLRKDLSRRFNEIREIDKLYWELQRFGRELRNTEL